MADVKTSQNPRGVITEEVADVKTSQSPRVTVTDDGDIKTSQAPRVAVTGDGNPKFSQFFRALVYAPNAAQGVGLLGPRMLGAAILVASFVGAGGLEGPRAIGTPTFASALFAPSLTGQRYIGTGYVIDIHSIVEESLVGPRAVGAPTIQGNINGQALVGPRALGTEDAYVVPPGSIVHKALAGPRRLGVHSVEFRDQPRTPRFRVLSTEYGSPGIIVVKAVAEDAGLYTGYIARGGSPSQEALTVPGLAGSTRLAIFDSVALRDSDQGTYGAYVAVTGYGANWFGSIVSVSHDDGQTYTDLMTIDTPAAIGYARTTLGVPIDPDVFDYVSTLDVQVIRPDLFALSSATEADVLAGANAAALIQLDGSTEIIQWATATPVVGATGKYTLTGLLRGRRGSGATSTGHLSGEQFVVLDLDRLRRINLTASDVGVEAIYKAVTSGTLIEDAVAMRFSLIGASA